MRRSPLSSLAAALVVLSSGCRDAPLPLGGAAASGAAAASAAPSAERAAPSASPSTSSPTGAGAAPSAKPLPARDEIADIAPPAPHASDALVGGSARRATARAVVDDVVMRANPELVANHFGDAPPYPLEVQRVALHGGRQAVLVTSSARDSVPLIVVADEAGHALWTKRRPLAGTREQARGISIVAGPEGSIALAWWDEPTRAVALRRWDFDGAVFADYHLFDADSCDGLDAVYWPGHGWIVTVTSLAENAARSSLITESGLAGFGGSVVEVTSSEDVRSRAAAIVGIDGIYYAYVGWKRGQSPRSRVGWVWATQRREDGSAAWKDPVMLGRAPEGTGAKTSDVQLSFEARAILRVDVGGSTFRVASDSRRMPPLPPAP